MELSSRPSFMKPSSLTPVYCIRLRSILPDIIRITLFMLSFIRAVFRQPHGGVIYTESGASGKRRRKETAPSTILTKQFKRLSCLSFLLVHVWKESSSMAANEAEGRGEWKFDTSARIYTSRMTNGESSTESYSIFHFSRLQLNRFLVLISKCGKNNSLVFFFFFFV